MQLKLVNGTMVVYNALGLDGQCVHPQGELNVTIEVKLPQTPGTYILSFRLVYGENRTDFGEEVTVNLVAKAPTDQVETPIDNRVLNALEQPLTETNGDTFYVDQGCCPSGCGDPCKAKCCDGGASVNDLDLSIDSWFMVKDDEEAAEETPGSIAKLDDEEAPSAPEPERQVRCEGAEVQGKGPKEQVAEEEEAEDDNYLFAWLRAGCSSIERGVLALKGQAVDGNASSQLID